MIFTSKWIGLLVFVISNITTGIINFFIEFQILTDINDEKVVFIISSYLFFVYFGAYSVYKKLNLRNDLVYKNTSNKQMFKKTLKII